MGTCVSSRVAANGRPALERGLTVPKETLVTVRREALARSRSGDPLGAFEIIKACLAQHPDDPKTRTVYALIEDAVRQMTQPRRYWGRRHDMIYLAVVKSIATRIAGRARSIVDVGSFGTPILDWFPDVETRYSVDLLKPFAGEGVIGVTSDFLLWEPPMHFDVGLCFQVIEHVPDAASFSRKLLATCDVLIVSLPYLWPADKAPEHVHDPVDEMKMLSWFERQPNNSYIVREIPDELRIVAVYDNHSQEKLSTIDERGYRYRWIPPQAG